jgi:type IV secretory pathway TraG/TraD family ATPase VirD4
LKDFSLRRSKTGAAIAKLKNYVDNPAKETIGGYISQAITKLSAYVDIGMATVMSDTELPLNEIISKPYAIFCVVPDENRSRHPLAALFTSQLYKYLIHLAAMNEKKTGMQALPNDFYFFLDEFGNFPKMDCIQEMLSIGGGRKIWTCIVIQALGQLQAKYGKDTTSTLLNNLHLQLYMGAPELETNKFFSEFIGYKTVRKNSVSLSSADLAKELSGNTQMEKSALINPDELARLQAGEIVFKIFKDQPVKTRLIHFYDKELQEKGYFIAGRPNIQFNTKAFDRETAFYDLIERDNNYDNLNSTEEITAIENEFAATGALSDHAQENKNPTNKAKKQSTADFVQMLKKKV